MLTWILFSTLLVPQPVSVADDSLLAVRVNKDEGTLFSGWSHNHAIRAKRFDAKASLDPESGACTVEIRVPVAELEVDPPALRRRFGLEGELDADDREEIRENMLDPDQLDAKRYPSIALRSERCTLEGKRLRLKGRFELRGQSRAVEVELDRTRDERGRDRFTGAFDIKGSEYGLEPYSAGLGAVKNADEMTIHLELYVKLPE